MIKHQPMIKAKIQRKAKNEKECKEACSALAKKCCRVND